MYRSTQEQRSPAVAARYSNALTKYFVVLVFFLGSTGALVPLFRSKGGLAAGTTSGDPVTQVLWFLVYTITLFLIVARWPGFVRTILRDKLLLLLVGVALVSVLWSAAPEVTLRRGVALVGTTLFGAYLATRYEPREQLRFLAWALGAMAVFSLLFALALPSYGLSTDPSTAGDWRGVFSHKNTLGSNMTMGAMAFALLAASSRRHRWLLWSGFGLSTALVVLSGSATALVVLLTLLALWPLYRALRWSATLAVPFLIFVVLLGGGLAVWLLGSAETVLNALGRDVTLTGRTEVWAVLVGMAQEHPLLGYGYNAFWLGWEGPSAQVWLATMNTSVPNVGSAHNGFLDLWLDLGLLGVGVFALGFLLAIRRAVAWSRAVPTADGLWPLMFLTFLVLYSVTESVVLSQNSTSWILYVATVLSTFVHPHQVRKGVGVQGTPARTGGVLTGHVPRARVVRQAFDNAPKTTGGAR